MPHYFFDVHDVIELVDKVGINLPDLIALRREASRTLAEIAVDLLPKGGASSELAITVRDDRQIVVFRAYLTFTTCPVF